jgi:hypothetical protein
MDGMSSDAASCERLFKDYALFHTKARNRLKKEKYHKMAQVKHALHKKRALDLASGGNDSDEEEGISMSNNDEPDDNTPETQRSQHATITKRE